MGRRNLSATYVGFTPFSYDLNTTYFVVLKYTFVTGSANDKVEIIVNPTLGAAEPTLGWITTLVNDPSGENGLAGVSFYQMTNTGTTTVSSQKISCLRVGTAWADVSSELGLKTINLTTAGTLSSSLTASEKSTILKLIVTGNVDARDFKCVQKELTNISVVDMSAAVIQSYTGNLGPNPSSVTYPGNQVPEYAFCDYATQTGKSTLVNFSFPTTATSIGNQAFYGCSAITSFVLGSALATIGNAAFLGCSSLTEFVVAADNAAFSSSNGVLFDKNQTVILQYPITKQGSYDFPATVTAIGPSAFRACAGLTGNITFSANFVSIGDYAFYDCVQVKVIYSLNPTPPAIGSNSFNSNPMLYVPVNLADAYKNAAVWNTFTMNAEKHVTIHNPTAGSLAATLVATGNGPISSITHLSITGNLNQADFVQMRQNMDVLTVLDISGASIENNTLPDNAFYNKTTLMSIKLPSTIKTIGASAFFGCSALLGSVPLPAGVTLIGGSAYYGCKSLTGTITIPTGVTALRDDIFNGCSGLTGNLVIPNNVISVCCSAFSGCSGLDGTLTLGNSLITIGNAVFYNCSKLKGALTIPNTVLTVGDEAFYGCQSFTSLSIGTSVTSIGNSSFYGCTGLRGALVLSPNLSYIGKSAFQVCENLNELYIDSISLLSEYCFNSCSAVSKIYVSSTLPPELTQTTFGGINKSTCTLYVPVGAGAAYSSHIYWNEFNKVTEQVIQLPTSTARVENNEIRIYVSQNHIVVEGIQANLPVQVYNLSGSVLKTVLSEDFKTIIPIEYQGLLVVRTPAKSFKIFH